MTEQQVDYNSIFREVYMKMAGRRNFFHEAAYELDFNHTNVEVVIDHHTKTPEHRTISEPMFTMVRVSQNHDGRNVVHFTGFSKRNVADRKYNPELAFRIALHRALTSDPTWTFIY